MTEFRVVAVFVVCLYANIGFADWFEVRRESHPLTIQTTGVVVPKNSLRFNPPPTFFWDMNISELVQEGANVKEGDVLVRFEGTREDQRLINERQQLLVLRGELASLVEQNNELIETEKLNLAQARSDAEKAHRKATQPTGLIADVEYQKLVLQRELADRRVEQLVQRAELSAKARESRMRRLELAVQRVSRAVASAQADKDRLTIRAPRAGIAVIGTSFNGEKFDVGMSSQPGQVIVELIEDAVLEISGDVHERLAAQIEVGLRARMTAEAAGGIEFTGVVETVGQSVRRKSRYSQEMVRELRIALDEQPANLTLGVSVQVVLEVQRVDNAIAVPINAIRYRDGDPGVAKRSGWTRVQLGARSNGKVIVTNGLEIGDAIEI